MQTQLLVSGPEEASLRVDVRFLHVADRVPLGSDLHRSRGRDDTSWEEAIPRSASLPTDSVRMNDLIKNPVTWPIAIEAGRSAETDEAQNCLLCSWRPLSGTVRLEARKLSRDLFRVTLRIDNTSNWIPGETHPSERLRGAAVKRSFISTHAILRVDGGEFVSLLEPPGEFQRSAEECVNLGLWPVLAGDRAAKNTLLASPIILYDYPEVSAKSPGDLYDATEIDELLTLSIQALTDDEKRQMRESDPRGRAILERTESLTQEQILKMHGVWKT
jgi:hypothetical protein